MKIQTYSDYIAASRALISFLSAQKEDPDLTHVVLVPDIYTLAFERMLYKNGGSFSIVVRSFSTLYRDRCAEGTALKKTQAILLVKKIAYDLREELTCFSHSYQKTGFAKKIYETVSRLREQGVAPELLYVDSMKKAKIDDLRKIYQEYLARTKHCYVDGAGKIEALTAYFQTIGSEPNTTYHVLNFDVLTDAMRELLTVIGQKSEVIEYDVPYAPFTCKAKSLSVYRAANDVDQLKATARAITRDVYDGMEYDRICVATEQANYERIRRIFEDYQIPFTLGKRIPLSRHPLAAYLTDGALAVRKGMKREDVIAFAQSPYLGKSKAEQDAFVRYAVEFLVSFKGFSEPFTKESRYAKGAESVRKAVLDVLLPLRTLRTTCTAQEWVNACFAVLQKRAAVAVPADMISDERAKESIESVLAGIPSIYGEQSESVETFLDLTRDLLESTEFSPVPQHQNAVAIGPLNAFRGQAFDKVYLLGFEEGVVPKAQEDCALLTDSDIAELEEGGMKFEPKIERLNRRYRDELWQLLQNDGELVCSYTTAAGSKRSFDLDLLEQEMWGGENRETDGDAYASALETETNPDVYARLVANRENAAEQAYLIRNPLLASSLYRVGSKGEEGERTYALCTEDASLSEISVSRVTSYYRCPYAYFCEYVLGIKPLQDGSVNVMDVGTILHGVLSEYLASEEKDPLESKVQAMVAKQLSLNERAELEENKEIIRRLQEEAVKLCRIARAQIERGEYVVRACEEGFGRKGRLQPLVFQGQNGEIPLVGVIDRIDVWKDRARVIDYKTGGAGSFHFSDVYYGNKLQLPLYMEVVKQAGLQAGGYFYFPLLAEWGTQDKDNRLSGIYEESDDNVEAMDRIALSGNSTVLDIPIKKGKITKKGGVTADQLSAVGAYAKRMTQRAIEHIESGSFVPRPRKMGQADSCQYCEYAGMCGFDRDGGRFRSCSASESAAAAYLKRAEEK